ncbi:hypothetical protein PHISP_07885 [Aspergillus sp. HF37]|nr:hypothetical protein PHISP_07885 [Aspergillus sp. HF37]
MSAPTLVNLPPSDPVTPSDMGPGTPNSGTTSLSALSTTAIKDGHQGQPHHHGANVHHSPSTSMTASTTLEAERADRISRLAGLERVATSRSSGQSVASPAAQTSGYFDTHSGLKEKSTVGSASATGSVGGRTTWASGSDALDADKMSEGPGPDDAASNTSNISDEGNASLVGFGEGASTLSGPSASAYSHPGLSGVSSGGPTSSLGSPGMNRPSPLAAHLQSSRAGGEGQTAQSRPSPSPAGSNTPEPVDDVRLVDGMTYDPDVVDTTVRTPRLATPHSRDAGAG